MTEPQIARTRRLMIENVPDALVTGYETIIDGFKLPDPNDRHVLAAAFHGGASVIVTWNLKHFPTKALKPHGVVAQSPDTFLSALLGREQDTAVAALRDLRSRLKAPPYSVDDLLAGLLRQKLVKTVDLVRPMADRL